MSKLRVVSLLLALTTASPSCRHAPHGAEPGPGQQPATAFPIAAPEDVGLVAADLRRLLDTVTEWVDEEKPVGAVLHIIRCGKTVLHEARGFRDRERHRALRTDSIFRIRSMTKPVIGTAVLMLTDAGRLSLSDRVATYLPSFDNERSGDITVEQLLTHTSGLDNHDDVDIGLSRPSHEFASLRALVDEIGALGPSLRPGTFRYSSSNTATLGALVAEVTGAPVERFLIERIFGPLGMADTFVEFTPGCDWSDRACSTYQWSRDDLRFERYWHPGEPQRFRYFRASGGVYTTTSDYARFLSMWRNKGAFGDRRLLREATVEAALRQHPAGSYGHHWRVPATEYVGGMPRVFLHEGADSTLAMALPALDTIVLYFTQSRGPGIRPMFRSALSRVPAFAADTVVDLDGTTRVEDLPTPAPAHAAADADRVGTYVGGVVIDGEERLTGSFRYEVVRTSQGLRGTLIRPGGLWDGPLPGHDLIPLGGGRFVPGRVHDGRIVEVVRDGSVRFVRDASHPSIETRVEIRGRSPRVWWRLQRQR